MKRIITAGIAWIGFIHMAIPLSSQTGWQVSGSNVYLPSGRVGIGTSNPQQPLDVSGQIRSGGSQLLGSGQLQVQWWNTGDPANQKFTELIQQNGSFTGRFVNDAYTLSDNWLYVSRNPGTYTTKSVTFPSGSVGIGATNPNTKLEVWDRVTVLNGNRFWSLGAGRADGGTNGYPDPAAVSDGTFAIRDVWSQRDRLRIDAFGNIGIGTTTPAYKLAVNGTIGTKEVIVTNSGWADHVFQPGYHLRQLGEVSAFIREHHRLPGMPSAQEVAEKGVGLGEMQVKLLAKIEELTLHLIAADERNRELQERIARLEHHARID